MSKRILIKLSGEILAGNDKKGIDFEKFNADKVEITDTTVTITLPKTEIFETNILEDKLVLIDEKKSIFNPESKEDVQKALVDAKADLDIHLDAKTLLAKATKEAQTFIEAFLRLYIGEREIIFRYE